MRGRTPVAVLVVALACVSTLAGTAAAVTPNDPLWQHQWSLRQMNLEKAWDITTGNPNIVIATIDTGIDRREEGGDLAGAVDVGFDFVGGGYGDTHGHGTIVALEAVARGNNGIGIAGVCWRCKLMPVRVAAGGHDFHPARVAAGIRWAVDQGARVISLSFTDEGLFPTTAPDVASAIAYAAQRNVVVFASAGNTGTSVQTHPAATPGAYAVAGTDENDLLFPWSTHGPWVHLAAPGCHWVVTAWWPYGYSCGSSTAAPAAAGVAALMLSVNPNLTPPQIINALQSTAVPVFGIAGGRMDAYKALLAVGGRPPAAGGRPPAPPPPPPPAAPAQSVKRVAERPLPVSTRVHRGYLAAGESVRINVLTGRLQATLRSPKANSCSIKVASRADVWFAAPQARNVVSLVAKVPTGRYTVRVSCAQRRPARYALVLRAMFAEAASA